MRKTLWVTSGLCSEQAIVLFSENRETLTRSRFQSRLVEDLDDTAPIADETALLKLLSGLGDTSATHAQHIGDELLRQPKLV